MIWKILVVSLLTISLLAGCANEEEERDFKVLSDGIPDEQSDDVTTITMEGSNVSLEMQAKHIDRYYKKKETYMDSLFVKKFNETGEVENTLRCDNAVINEATNMVVCSGNVIVESENGVLKTPMLTWDRETDGILAEGGVVLERGDDVLRGDRMKTDMNMERVEIINVSAEGSVKESGIEW